MDRIKDPPVGLAIADVQPVPARTFEDLYATDYRPLVRLAVVMLDEHGRAEEVVQDSYAKVYERWGALDSPGGYLRTCVVNGCREVLRRRRLAPWRHFTSAPEFAVLGADDLLPAHDRIRHRPAHPHHIRLSGKRTRMGRGRRGLRRALPTSLISLATSPCATAICRWAWPTLGRAISDR